MILSEAAERVRIQLEQQQQLARDDVAELLEDYDALADTYQRVMKNLDAPK
jgi:DNA-binding ferritin-like protein